MRVKNFDVAVVQQLTKVFLCNKFLKLFHVFGEVFLVCRRSHRADVHAQVGIAQLSLVNAFLFHNFRKILFIGKLFTEYFMALKNKTIGSKL